MVKNGQNPEKWSKNGQKWPKMPKIEFFSEKIRIWFKKNFFRQKTWPKMAKIQQIMHVLVSQGCEASRGREVLVAGSSPVPVLEGKVSGKVPPSSLHIFMRSWVQCFFSSESRAEFFKIEKSGQKEIKRSLFRKFWHKPSHNWPHELIRIGWRNHQNFFVFEN